MKKKTFIVILALIGLATISYILIKKDSKKEPVTFTANAMLRELTIDDKIKEAELIVIGEVKTTLPSKWDGHNQRKAEDASPEEIWMAEGLFTDSLISIDQILKGSHKEPIVRVRTFVGETGQVRWNNSSEPIYEKGKIYLLFLHKDIGPTQIVDPGDYIAVNAIAGVYELIDDKAISVNYEWVLEELIAYIQNVLSETPTPNELLIEAPTDLPTQIPLPEETITPTP